MIDCLFRAHPRSVGESYAEHFGIAARVGAKMVGGGLACFVHALVPALFVRTGSRVVKSLYADIRARQPGLARTPAAHERPEWQLEYEI